MVEADAKRLGPNQWQEVADWVVATTEERKARRGDLERKWDEIDRQVEQRPRARQRGDQPSQEGPSPWYPEFETPLQIQTLEVTVAEAMAFMFPRGTEWFKAHAYIDDKYLDRFDARRQEKPLIGDEPHPFTLNQENANIFVKATMDHFHRMYAFRKNIAGFITEQVKYGEAVAMVRDIKMSKPFAESRGMPGMSGVIGPATIWQPIRNTYLDDSEAAMARQGVATTPVHIRHFKRKTEDLLRAVRSGGRAKGWFPRRFDDLDIRHNEGMVEIYEAEGDIAIASGDRVMRFTNSIITVVQTGKQKFVGRVQKFDPTMRSYVTGSYFNAHTPGVPYGKGPLEIGHTMADVSANALNTMLAVASLQAEPPVAYDRFDPRFAAEGGPQIHPRAQWAVDNPQSLQVLSDIGNLPAMLNMYLSALQQYEGGTGVNEPRLGERARSHTSATGAEIEDSRASSRTADFMADTADDPITNILYREFAIIRKVMRDQPVFVNEGGIQGWLKLGRDDLAEQVVFEVLGAGGVAERQQRDAQFVAAVGQILQLFQMSVQVQQPITVRFDDLAREVLIRAGEQDPNRFVPADQNAVVPTQGEPGLSAPVGGIPGDLGLEAPAG